MPSPFPGMDPYLERHWGDVHSSLVIYARDRLQSTLPRDLRARVEERVFVESPEVNTRAFIPDVRIVEGRRRKEVLVPSLSAVAVAEPIIVWTDDEVTEGYIEIREKAPGRRIVTAIEFLSPSNKLPGLGRKKFLAKRDELLEGGVSLVEIDLVREGKRPYPVGLSSLLPAQRTEYQVWVRRGWNAARVEVYPVPLRESLPVIRIPLRQTDADVHLDLQALIAESYAKGDYDDDIDYKAEPEPPLSREDARWADAILRKAGHRQKRRRKPGQRNGRA